MTSSLYHTFDMAIRSRFWPTESLLYHVFYEFTMFFIYLLIIHYFFLRLWVPLESILIRPDPRTIIDSGATVHICHDRRKLLNYRAFYCPPAILSLTGVGYTLGCGEMELTTVIKDDDSDTTRRETLRLYGVHHVPSAGVTLLSTEQLRLQGIFYSTEKGILYRRHRGCEVVVGETDVVKDTPYLKTVDDELGGASSLPPRFDIRPWSLLPLWSWCSQHLFAARPTEEHLAARISKLENDNDELEWTLDCMKQKNAALESSLSLSLSLPPITEPLRYGRGLKRGPQGIDSVEKEKEIEFF